MRMAVDEARRDTEPGGVDDFAAAGDPFADPDDFAVILFIFAHLRAFPVVFLYICLRRRFTGIRVCGVPEKARLISRLA